MRFEKIVQYNHKPSIRECVHAQVRERAAHQIGAGGKPVVSIAQAYEEAERALEMLQAQSQPLASVAKVASAPVKTLRPLVGLADGVVSVDDLEEELIEIVGPFAGDEEPLDEGELMELAVDATLSEENKCQTPDYAICEDDSSDDQESNIEV